MKKSRKNINFKNALILGVLLVTLTGSVYLLNNKRQVLNKPKAEVSYPITGTFLMTDMSFSDPYAGYKSLMADMQKVGIDTVIVSGTGMLFKNKDGSYSESVWAGDKALDAIAKSAKDLGMKIFWGVAGTSWNPDAHFTAEEQRKLLDLSLRSIEAIKNG